MKERILDAIAQMQQEHGAVAEIHLWSREAVEAITSSSELKDGSFMGIPVKYLGRNGEAPPQDFILIPKG